MFESSIPNIRAYHVNNYTTKQLRVATKKAHFKSVNTSFKGIGNMITFKYFLVHICSTCL